MHVIQGLNIVYLDVMCNVTALSWALRDEANPQNINKNYAEFSTTSIHFPKRPLKWEKSEWCNYCLERLVFFFNQDTTGAIDFGVYYTLAWGKFVSVEIFDK
jgi:hypothetical protein